MGPNPHQFDKWNNKVFINIKKYKIIHSWTPSPFIKEGGIEFSKLSQTKEEGGGSDFSHKQEGVGKMMGLPYHLFS